VGKECRTQIQGPDRGPHALHETTKRSEGNDRSKENQDISRDGTKRSRKEAKEKVPPETKVKESQS
jgi:hypothetical protein